MSVIPDIWIMVQAEDYKTAKDVITELRKSTRKARRLAEGPLAGKRIGYKVFNDVTLANAQTLPGGCAMQ